MNLGKTSTREYVIERTAPYSKNVNTYISQKFQYAIALI